MKLHDDRSNIICKQQRTKKVVFKSTLKLFNSRKINFNLKITNEMHIYIKSIGIEDYVPSSTKYTLDFLKIFTETIYL